ncbi:hypothetical protein B0H16DRAFT_1877468 [Mycena metata]|uniref:Uncharacterized protein n=1 Tax=Mycena metata TaxID=1033252 RepID=A0AAD7KEK9_9AGAR|nr:hypothetical protein B0H16DRAFT_1877468 [Mycena metata]
MQARLRPVAARFAAGLSLYRHPCFARHLTRPRGFATNPLGEDVKVQALQKEEKHNLNLTDGPITDVVRDDTEALNEALSNLHKLRAARTKNNRQHNIIIEKLRKLIQTNSPDVDKMKAELLELQTTQASFTTEIRRVRRAIKKMNRRMGLTDSNIVDSTVTAANEEILPEKLPIAVEEKYLPRIHVLEEMIQDMKGTIQALEKKSDAFPSEGNTATRPTPAQFPGEPHAPSVQPPVLNAKPIPPQILQQPIPPTSPAAAYDTGTRTPRGQFPGEGRTSLSNPSSPPLTPRTSVSLSGLPPFVTLSDLGRISLYAGASAADVLGFHLRVRSAPFKAHGWDLGAAIHFRSEESARQFTEKPLLLQVQRPDPASPRSTQPKVDVFTFSAEVDMLELQRLHARTPQWNSKEFNDQTRVASRFPVEHLSLPNEKDLPHGESTSIEHSVKVNPLTRDTPHFTGDHPSFPDEKDLPYSESASIEHKMTLTSLWDRLHATAEPDNVQADALSSPDLANAEEGAASIATLSTVQGEGEERPAPEAINGEADELKTEVGVDEGQLDASPSFTAGITSMTDLETDANAELSGKSALDAISETLNPSESGEVEEAASEVAVDLEMEQKEVSRVLKLVFGPALDTAPPRRDQVQSDEHVDVIARKSGHPTFSSTHSRAPDPLTRESDDAPEQTSTPPEPMIVSVHVVPIPNYQPIDHLRPTTTRWLTLRVPGSGVPVFAPPNAGDAHTLDEAETTPESEHEDEAAAAYARALRKALARERELEAMLRRQSADSQERALELARTTAEAHVRADFGAFGALEGVWVREVRAPPSTLSELEGRVKTAIADEDVSMYELHALVAFGDVAAAARAFTIVPVQIPAYAKSGLRFVELPWREAMDWRHHSVSPTISSQETDGARAGWARRLEREQRAEALMREREKERERQRGAAEGTWGKERLSEIRERLRRIQRREEREREAAKATPRTWYERWQERTTAAMSADSVPSNGPDSDSDSDSSSDSSSCSSSSSSESETDSDSDSDSESASFDHEHFLATSSWAPRKTRRSPSVMWSRKK